MIVYHGTTQQIEHPDISFSKRYLDFGRGFYLTSYKKQAEKWAIRKALRQGTKPVVNIYELVDDLSGYHVLRFEEETVKWLDFVCACRRGEAVYQEYDIIIGNVADDDVFKSIDMYFRGLWDKERTIEELRYYKLNNQIAIVNQQALNQVLSFKKAYTVES